MSGLRRRRTLATGAVRPLLLDAPTFLGQRRPVLLGSGCGAGADGLIPGAEVWRVEPDLARAVAVPVSERVAYLHLPLVLVIGPAANPDRLHFLVSMLGVETEDGGGSRRCSRRPRRCRGRGEWDPLQLLVLGSAATNNGRQTPWQRRSSTGPR